LAFLIFWGENPFRGITLKLPAWNKHWQKRCWIFTCDICDLGCRVLTTSFFALAYIDQLLSPTSVSRSRSRLHSICASFHHPTSNSSSSSRRIIVGRFYGRHSERRSLAE